jgi:hypothetical protein
LARNYQIRKAVTIVVVVDVIVSSPLASARDPRDRQG